MARGLLEASGLVPRSRLGRIGVGFFGDHIGHQVLAVDGQTLEQLPLIGGGQRVDDDAVAHDPGKALPKIGAVHRVVQTPPGLGSVEQKIPGHLGPPLSGSELTLCHPRPARKPGGGTALSPATRRLPGTAQPAGLGGAGAGQPLGSVTAGSAGCRGGRDGGWMGEDQRGRSAGTDMASSSPFITRATRSRPSRSAGCSGPSCGLAAG